MYLAGTDLKRRILQGHHARERLDDVVEAQDDLRRVHHFD
jgi:hypothetical protein